VGQPFVAVQAGKNVSFEGIEFEDGESHVHDVIITREAPNYRME
jgi:hypothetical protein